MKLFGLLILSVFASEKKENGAANDPEYGEGIGSNGKNLILVKIEEDEYAKVSKKSRYIGVTPDKYRWRVQRWSRHENKKICNGRYDDEETAAHASDTLARTLLENGEHGHKLNFPGDYTEVYPEKKNISSKFIGVSFNEKESKWKVQRWSKNENKFFSNGSYDNEETAAHASDTVARKLMDNGKKNHKLNFPGDYTEIYPEEKNISSKFFGVSLNEKESKWKVQRWSKHEKKRFSNGSHDDEETAAHASDTLARLLMDNGEQGHNLNFPDDNTEIYPEKKENSSIFIGVTYSDQIGKWKVQRWSRNEKKIVPYGSYGDEETAAHASDTLARKLMINGELKLALNFPGDKNTQIPPQENQNKRKRQKKLSLQNN